MLKLNKILFIDFFVINSIKYFSPKNIEEYINKFLIITSNIFFIKKSNKKPVCMNLKKRNIIREVFNTLINYRKIVCSMDWTIRIFLIKNCIYTYIVLLYIYEYLSKNIILKINLLSFNLIILNNI